MARFEEWDVEGPVQAEVYVVCLADDGIVLTGPCGAAPWYIEVGEPEHPMAAVERIVADVIGPPRLIHSTSWRRDRDAVILTFLVVIDTDQVGPMATIPVGREELARSAATSAPTVISDRQVVEHALRHLAWLAMDDAAARTVLSGEWKAALSGYVPEPFQNIG